MALSSVARAERWIAAGLFALGGVLWVARDAPAAPARATRPLAKVSPREARRIELGRRLFFEPTVSAMGTNSCASCHDPEHGFSDPAVRSRDDFSLTPRHSQPLVDVDTSMALHWDGGIKDLGEIVDRRMSSPDGGGYEGGSFGFPEPDLAQIAAMNASVQRDLGPSASVTISPFGLGRLVILDEEEVQIDVRPGPQARYREAVEALGSEGKEGGDVIRAAIAAYVKSLRSSASAYDRYAAGDDAALSASAQRGLALFQGRARCSECHALEDGGWPMLRDGKYHNTGLAWMGIGRDDKEGRFARAFARVARRLGVSSATGDPGRGAHVTTPEMLRAFKTPTLRDVAVRPPYMHDGSLATLADVVKHYAAGCGDDPSRDALVRAGFTATEGDVADLVAFLESLTSDERPGLATEPWRHRAARTRLTFVDAVGAVLTDFEVTLEAAGDRAFKGAARPEPRTVRTDAAGRIDFVPTPFTHVRLTLPNGLEPRDGALVPDTCQDARITVPVAGRVRLALVVPDGVETTQELRAYQVVASPVVDFARAAANAVQVTVAPKPWLFTRAGVTPLDGRQVALYEGWLPADGGQTVLFRLPGQKQTQKVELKTGETLRIDVTKG